MCGSSGQPNTDGGLFRISESRYSNRIYKSDSFKAWFINDVDNWTPKGTTVCTAARNFGHVCGVVSHPTRTSFPATDTTVDVILRRQMFFDVIRNGHNLPEGPGSSGGPIIGDQNSDSTKRDAIGIIVRGSANNEYFVGGPGTERTHNQIVVSRAGFLEDDLGVTIQTSAP